MVDGLLNRPEGANAADIRNELQDSMQDLAFVVRTEESLRKMQEILGGLRERFDHVYVQDTGKMFNTELMEVVELGFLLECADALVAAALARDESRGGHYREDHPLRDDANWLQALAGVPGRRRVDPARTQARETGTLRTHGTEVLMAATASDGLGEILEGSTCARRRGPQGHPHAQDPPLQPGGPRRGVVVGRVRDPGRPRRPAARRACTRSSGTTTGRWRSDARARTASAVRTR